MRMARLLALCVALSTVCGCFVAKIETGLPVSSDVITQKWASCWIYGLVPPKTVKTAAKCSNGVSIVETQQSFLNRVAAILTWGIYTPMQITVTCASKPAAELMRPAVNLEVSESATTEEFQSVFAQAAEAAVRTGEPVAVYTIR